MFIRVAVIAASLTGCAHQGSTIPSPTEQVAEGAFQARLHQTQGAGEHAVDGQFIRANAAAAGSGAAAGCTLTVLGPVPAGVTFRLVAGECEASARE